MKRSLLMGLVQGLGIMLAIIVVIAVAVAADILTVDKDGTIRLRVSDQGKVTLNASTTTEGDLRLTTRSSDPTAPLAGDLWYNNTVKEVKYADGGLTKPIASMTNADLTLYVNGATGNDNNDGLTSGTAVKTIQKAVNLIPPIVRHSVTVDVYPKDGSYVFRDTGATVGTWTYNVYVADKNVTAAGSITFLGDETTPSNVRVTGSNSGADTTAVRNVGFMFYSIRNVSIKGFLCNYFVNNGIYYYRYSTGNPANCLSNNNSIGIYFDWYSFGSPSSCTTNSNSTYGLNYFAYSAGWPDSCTINSNTSSGIQVSLYCSVSPSNCSISSNGSHGIRYHMSSGGWPSNNTSSSNNSGYGIYASAGSTVDFSGTTPNGSSGATGADANYSLCY